MGPVLAHLSQRRSVDLTSDSRALRTIPKRAALLSTAASDPGCVKTLEAIVGAQQKNRTRGLNESFMRGRPSLCINLVPERPVISKHPAKPAPRAGRCLSVARARAEEAPAPSVRNNHRR